MNQKLTIPLRGSRAPSFECTAVIAGEETKLILDDYRFKGKYLVLYFYDFNFSFIAPLDVMALTSRTEELKKENIVVVGVACESHFSHQAWVKCSPKEGGLGGSCIPLIADKNGQVAKAYGVFDEHNSVAFRSMFIIDPKKSIRTFTMFDKSIGVSADDIIRDIRALKHVDETGNVCPTGWTPEQKGMMPTDEERCLYLELMGLNM